MLCISTSFLMSWLLLSDLTVNGQALPQLWWQLATIISCGTLGAVLIPEFTKIFTSSHSKHVHEIVTASREGGASLTILSGLVSGTSAPSGWACSSRPSWRAPTSSACWASTT